MIKHSVSSGLSTTSTEIFESLGIISGLAERDKGFRDVITNASN